MSKVVKKPYIIREKILFIILLLIISVFRFIEINSSKSILNNQPTSITPSSNIIENSNTAGSREETAEPVPEKRFKNIYTIKQILNENLDYKAFLTFDDGPSRNTEEILKILKKYNIKATFFIVGKAAENQRHLVKKIHSQGHSIGNHSYSHNVHYKSFSPEKFLEDINKNDMLLKDILGKDFKTNLVRFPGGSFNLPSYKNKLKSAGYEDINWNASNGDTASIRVPTEVLLNNIYTETEAINRRKQGHSLVILMHDLPTKETTVETLPKIIEYLKNKGYEFCIISENN
ncbi:polysaccharide deacetylase family protein [Clostridium polynesiense]|uniref:polysaccharide deacetylase family protein n=1 Tax=Clostridium polynesiense TaxID=1325933 RepID=UPI0006944B21|nr:polysaccharide deacetylase family protein [Clostridium polynesiense]